MMIVTRRTLGQLLAGGAFLAVSGAHARPSSNGGSAIWIRFENLVDALLTTASATATLSALARSRGWDPDIRVNKLEADSRPASAAIAHLLDVVDGAMIGYRKVTAGSGDRVLSLVENWFVPERLGAAVNERLDTGHTPFGSLIARLEPSRRVLSSERFWTSATAPIPEEIFQMSAVVTGVVDGKRIPLAIVRETYQAAAIA